MLKLGRNNLTLVWLYLNIWIPHSIHIQRKPAMRSRIAIKSVLSALLLIITAGCILMLSQYTHSDDFDAAQTIRDAEIGTYSRDYYDYEPEDATEASEPDYEVDKSETLYVDGKMVCFKLESGVSVAYFCNN